MDEKDLELIRILNETRNITKAAERLYITQSALSKRIRSIENELGVTLMTRSRHGIDFTPEGEEVLSQCLAAQEAMKKMRRNLEKMNDDVCGTLRAGVSIDYALYRLPDILSTYHRLYPKVRLNITTEESDVLYNKLLQGRIDIAILRFNRDWDGPKYMISEEKEYVVCSQENKDVSLADYMYIDHVTDSIQSEQMFRWRREKGLVSDEEGICVNNIKTCLELVERGLGWAILPGICLDNFTGVKIPCVFENGEPLTRCTYLLGQRETMSFKQNKAFFDMLRTMD